MCRGVHPAQVAELLQRNKLFYAEQFHKGAGAYDRNHPCFGDVSRLQLMVAIAVGVKVILASALAHGLQAAAGRNTSVRFDAFYHIVDLSAQPAGERCAAIVIRSILIELKHLACGDDDLERAMIDHRIREVRALIHVLDACDGACNDAPAFHRL